MKHPAKKTAFCLAILISLVMAAGCTTGPQNATTITATTLPAQGSGCGLTSCHGLDLACGADAPEVCTMEYRLGDRCRRFAHCGVTGNGACQLTTDPEFETCKSCVQACETRYGNDPAGAFSCEEKC